MLSLQEICPGLQTSRLERRRNETVSELLPGIMVYVFPVSETCSVLKLGFESNAIIIESQIQLAFFDYYY